MHHRHEDAVIFLDSEVVDFTIKVVVKGQTCSYEGIHPRPLLPSWGMLLTSMH
jgi:hypothetical protein